MAEEEKGFVIKDRRGRGGESEAPRAPAAERPESAQEQGEQAMGPLPPINFPSFIYSMGTSALMLLGESPQPGAPAPAPNLRHAQEIIDILTMLETKTKGNLTADEETLLEEMLYTLRIKFVERASGAKT